MFAGPWGGGVGPILPNRDDVLNYIFVIVIMYKSYGSLNVKLLPIGLG